MSGVRAAWLISAVVLLTSLAFLTACQRSQQSALDRLHPCTINEGPTEAFCGTYSVFEDRSAKTGHQIALKIVVAPALKRNPQPDPLFILEGGPGAGAATLAYYVLPIHQRQQNQHAHLSLRLPGVVSILYPLSNRRWLAPVPIFGQYALAADVLGGKPPSVAFYMLAGASVLAGGWCWWGSPRGC